PAFAEARRLVVCGRGIASIQATFRFGQAVLARQRLSPDLRTFIFPLPGTLPLERDHTNLELVVECDETVTPLPDTRALCLAVEWVYLDAGSPPGGRLPL